MNTLLQFGTNTFNYYVEVQNKINKEMIENSKSIQKLLLNKNATPEDWKKLQDNLMKSTANLSKLLEDLNKKYADDSLNAANENFEETKDAYKGMTDKVSETYKTLQDYSLNMYSEAMEYFRNLQSKK